jgi:hypothetical protein
MSINSRNAGRLFNVIVKTCIRFAQAEGDDSTRIGFDRLGVPEGTYGMPARPRVTQHMIVNHLDR